MRWWMAAGLCVAVISGCTGLHEGGPVLGPIVDSPPGWLDYCRRHPTDVDCQRHR